ncbi:MAG: N-acetylneuraminate synthase [Planctomycetes bacterium]|nr:N-acetylneuraminate synthase [Planctomycetota bacterium]
MPQAYIIAEAGVNHNGSVELALRLVDLAAAAGADAVKFQTFKADRLVTPAAPKARYQKLLTDASETQHAMLRKLELDEDTHRILIGRCAECGIQFMSTPFDTGSLDLLATRLGLSRIKLPSGEITNAPLLIAAARTGKPLILSTGMSTLGEVEAALAVLAYGLIQADEPPGTEAFQRAYLGGAGRAALQRAVTLLHCTTEYPTPFDQVNLLAMDTLRAAFGLPVGLSDHTPGIAVPIAAVARGAVVIEKHFTTDRGLPGPDHKASLEPAELTAMVQAIRQVEAALGSAVKAPALCEIGNRAIARQSLVAARDIVAGEMFTLENLTTRRPGGGVAPMRMWEWLDRPAARAFAANELIAP